MPIFSQFGEIVWQRLLDIARILQTTALNVHPGGDITKHVCELNNKTRQMKSDDFIEKSGSSFYGQVKVRSQGD